MCKETKKSGWAVIGKTIVFAAVLGVLGLGIASLPELKRFIKIRTM
jgi:preprotein translocase subunit SecE